MTQEAKNMARADALIDVVCNKPKRVISRYDGFVPIDIELLGSVDKSIGGIAFTDSTPSALDSSLDISIFNYDNGKCPNMLVRARKATPDVIRKKTNVFSSDGYTLDYIHLDTGYTNSIPVEVKRDDLFSNAKLIVPHGYAKNQKTEEEAKTTISIMAGLQFTIENLCCVYLKPEDAAIGFVLPIPSLSSAKELFKLREIEPGKKRRTALKHFVAEHSRRLPSDPNETVMVAKYLRGAERFCWDGFEGRIDIPAFLLKA